MGRLTVVAALAALLLPARALAADPLAASATPAAGATPLVVTLTAAGGAEPYRWDFGDGASGEGAVVEHVYSAGEWTATVSAGGETASVAVHAEAVTASGPRHARYGAAASFSGRVEPAAAGTPVTLELLGSAVASGFTAPDGSFRLRAAHLRAPGPYVVRTPLAVSAPATVLVRPLLRLSTRGAPLAGAPLAFRATLVPAAAGRVVVRVSKRGTLIARATGARSAVMHLRVAAEAELQVRADSAPAPGYAAASAATTQVVLAPALAPGSRGPSVRVLERRLAAMHYALRGVDGLYADDTADAVLAFQKVHGLARTARVDAALWRRILAGHTPAARRPGTHVEVSKTRQVLYEVRGGKVVLVVHVSTGATGNTPVGVWHVYRRVPGFDWVLYYPTYFVGGFAIHGYPEVPAYPASHGCVRVPMWVAQRLYAMDGAGTTVYVDP